MAVVIRLARHGRRNLPYYRIVAADKEMPRSGRYLELLGTFNTRTSPTSITLNEDRVKYWISVGARPSDTVAQYIEKLIPGYFSAIETERLEKIRSRRAKRKARHGETAAPKSESAAPAKKKAAKKS